MANVKRCDLCTDKCPKAETLHETSKGRMYATKAFIDLQKKVDNAELVKVVRCKDCVNARPLDRADELVGAYWKDRVWCIEREGGMMPEEYCSSGKCREHTETSFTTPTVSEDESVFLDALNTYGMREQITIVFEEMSELQKELCKYLRGDDAVTITNIAEEIADVEIMLAQMKLFSNAAPKLRIGVSGKSTVCKGD